MAKGVRDPKKPEASTKASAETYFVFEDTRTWKTKIGGLEERAQIEPDVESAKVRLAMVMRALKASDVKIATDLPEHRFLHPQFKSSPDMLQPRVEYKRDKPKSLSEFLWCQPFFAVPVEKRDEISCLMVSARWRYAIESVEPNVHKFWAVERVYKDQVVRDYFWLLTKRWIPTIFDEPPHSVFKAGGLDRELRYWSRRDSLAGLHWARYEGYIVSGTLLQKLRPLFSPGEKRDFKFYPITLVDDPAGASREYAK